MNTQIKIGAAVLALVLAFASGRYLSPTKTITEVKTVTVDRVVVKVEHSVTVIKEKPDGTKETTIISDSKANSKTDSTSVDTTKVAIGTNSRTNISVLVGSGFPLTLENPTYGLSITKNILGPVTAGIWGLTDKTVGVSLGISF